MTYGIRMDIPGMTEQQYQQMHEVLGPKGRSNPALITHMAGPTENGWFILELWESMDDFDRFVQEEILPITPPGAPIPQPQVFEVRVLETRGT